MAAVQSTTPGKVQAATKKYRQGRNDELEDEVHKVVLDLGFPCRQGAETPSEIGLDHLTGEIDTILADPSTETIWILEVKDPQESFSPRQISDDIDDFLGDRKDYAPKLFTTVGELARFLTEVTADDCESQLST
ncbi:MAG TPA: hypothetical protein VNF07_02265 [Acidimicrobiales bacterium]|nr:hypothetical protein [Acidimicrobiales bacterium]